MRQRLRITPVRRALCQLDLRSQKLVQIRAVADGVAASGGIDEYYVYYVEKRRRSWNDVDLMSEDKEEWVEAVLVCGRLNVCPSSLSSRLMYVFALWASMRL